MADDDDENGGESEESTAPKTASLLSDEGESESGSRKMNIPVESTCFTAMVYDLDSGDLEVTFAKGGTYMIPGISESEIDRWTKSGSPGVYFNSFVRGR